jgi:hypothetical protein
MRDRYIAGVQPSLRTYSRCAAYAAGPDLVPVPEVGAVLQRRESARVLPAVIFPAPLAFVAAVAAAVAAASDSDESLEAMQQLHAAAGRLRRARVFGCDLGLAVARQRRPAAESHAVLARSRAGLRGGDVVGGGLAGLLGQPGPLVVAFSRCAGEGGGAREPAAS